MNEVALCFAAIPFLAGQTTLAVGVLAAGLAFSGMWQTRDFTWRGALFGIVAGLLSFALQYALHRAREWLLEFSSTMRALERRLELALTTCLSMLFAAAVLYELGAAAVEEAREAVALAGFDERALIILAVGVLAFGVGLARSRVAELLREAPLVTELGVRRAFFFAEATWTLVGLSLTLLFPLFGLVLFAGLLAVMGVTWAVARRVAGGRGACAACGAPLHLAAPHCPACAAPRAPRRLGVLGQPLDAPAPDAAAHALSLLAQRRCPWCAEGLRRRDGVVVCSRCARQPFGSVEEAKAFVRRADARVLAMTPVFGALGLVPVAGLGLALFLYRVGPGGALSGYATVHERLGVRATKWLALAGLALLQPVPLVGVGAVLAMVAIQQAWNRRAFLAAPQLSPSP